MSEPYRLVGMTKLWSETVVSPDRKRWVTVFTWVKKRMPPNHAG